MTKLRLKCINLGSKSAKALAEDLTAKLKYKVWRSKQAKPGSINLIYGDQADKVQQYEFFKANQLPAPPFTKDITEARVWAGQGITVFCRTLTKASEGKGIVVADEPKAVVNAPVYTAYLKKKREFRVHIFKDKVVTVLEKRRKADWDGPKEPKIRNTANGYVFCHDNVVEPAGIRDLALKARLVTKSDFAGVDIGYNELKKQLFVIEVNSAPGIEGSNVQRYTETILKHYAPN